ncbi:Laccase-1 [Eumeta japonica]|uniref:Laccase-1 n=1 Tax=Eumeta variegata TaxID=151549 RepID=A0A4C1WZ00_EUMVA|nr:Laccase-1 [Eumeta japonica]
MSFDSRRKNRSQSERPNRNARECSTLQYPCKRTLARTHARTYARVITDLRHKTMTRIVSNNGKASVDDLAPSSKMLFEDNTKSSDESCYRPCKFNVKPRRCFYKFKIEPMIDEQGVSIAINNMVPGPPIHVCVNDVVVVEVQNKVPGQDLAMHWHGIDQSWTPYMDGVPMITQCPINFGATYKYAFRASNPGTHFYHAHSVLHQADGVFGAFVVNQPSPLDPNSPLYDYDRSEENTLIISTKHPKLFTGSIEDLSEIRPSAVRINRQEDGQKIFVKEGYAYRLRVINAAVNCPVRAHLSGHELLVIASDGQPVKPVVGSDIALYPAIANIKVFRAFLTNNLEPPGLIDFNREQNLFRSNSQITAANAPNSIKPERLNQNIYFLLVVVIHLIRWSMKVYEKSGSVRANGTCLTNAEIDGESAGEESERSEWKYFAEYWYVIIHGAVCCSQFRFHRCDSRESKEDADVVFTVHRSPFEVKAEVDDRFSFKET